MSKSKEKRQAERIAIRGITAWLPSNHSLLGAVANMTPYGALIVGTNFLRKKEFYRIRLDFEGAVERQSSFEIDAQVMWQEEIEGQQHTGLSLKPHPEDIRFLERLIKRFGTSPWD
ncbi:MAG: PilZ domain-containing protein [Chloroflexi bacterium]|nr:MAG: PilZ domain-containing protein [Chloroflexota bacterium]MBL1193791.1 PilZ domain-containing protein [Chloroflexota bacterium]NOH11084.1 PilZ domain-containing protein [Chloroflexota bacterium]